MNEDPKITTKHVAPQEALKLLGWDLNHPTKGKVMVSTGAIRVKYYSARYRVGDGHLLYRWGRLTEAVLTYIDGKFSHACFS